MSVDIILLIVGAALILIAILGSLGANEKSSGFLPMSIKAFLGVVGICLIIYGGYSFDAVNLQGQIEQPEVGNVKEVTYPITSVQIISPLEGDSVECRILTMGVYPEEMDKDIWVLLKPTDEKYYPQSDHTNTSYKRNGEWQVITRFGGDELENYEIIVYEADATASAFFTATIEEWKAALSYPGLEEADLPEGAVEVERILVSLKENCRGVF